MWQIKEPWHWLHRYLYTHTPRSTNWARDTDIQLTVNKAPWRKAAIWSADTKRAWPCTLQNTRCWNGRTHWWNTRHRVLEHSDPQISRQDWEKGDFAERTWSALMASVRGCSVYFWTKRTTVLGNAGHGSRGLKIEVRSGQLGVCPARWGGAAKHLPSRSLLQRWNNLTLNTLPGVMLEELRIWRRSYGTEGYFLVH